MERFLEMRRCTELKRSMKFRTQLEMQRWLLQKETQTQRLLRQKETEAMALQRQKELESQRLLRKREAELQRLLRQKETELHQLKMKITLDKVKNDVLFGFACMSITSSQIIIFAVVWMKY